MNNWMDQFVKILENTGIQIFLIRTYKDDLPLICTNVKFGSHWDDKNIQHCQELKKIHF